MRYDYVGTVLYVKLTRLFLNPMSVLLYSIGTYHGNKYSDLVDGSL